MSIGRAIFVPHDRLSTHPNRPDQEPTARISFAVGIRASVSCHIRATTERISADRDGRAGTRKTVLTCPLVRQPRSASWASSNSQADNAGSIPVTRSTMKAQVSWVDAALAWLSERVDLGAIGCHSMCDAGQRELGEPVVAGPLTRDLGAIRVPLVPARPTEVDEPTTHRQHDRTQSRRLAPPGRH